jgi:hypothetical protein
MQTKGRTLSYPKFVLITPCIRPQNLNQIYWSIKPYAPFYDIRWIIVYDMEVIPAPPFPDEPWIERYQHQRPGGIAGHAQRNFALNLVTEGFVWQLDDDNIVHPRFFEILTEAILEKNKGFILFPQILNNGTIRNLDIRVGYIDNAQFIIDINLLGTDRYDETDYNADGHLIHHLYYTRLASKLELTAPLCYYNYLRP